MQYQLHSQNPAEKELNPQTAINTKFTEREALRETLIANCTQDALLRSEMDKPKSILSKRNTSPRGNCIWWMSQRIVLNMCFVDRLHSDYQHSYVPSFLDGFSFQDKSDEVEKVNYMKKVE